MPARVDHHIQMTLAYDPKAVIIFTPAIAPDAYVTSVEDGVTTLYVHPSHREFAFQQPEWGQASNDQQNHPLRLVR